MSDISFLNLYRLNESIRSSLDEAYHRVMDSGWYIMGAELEAFESEFARYCDVDYCVGVGNGLDALYLLLKAYGIGTGDEVIVPANTFVATWLAVTSVGAIPVPVEPMNETFNIDPKRLSKAISNKTKAIIPVHLYGQPADMDPICAVASKYGLIVIEDNAQAQGGRYKGRRTGSLGHAAATSFYPGKNLGAMGDGGAVVTNDHDIAERVRCLRNYGSKTKYQHDEIGINSRLDEMQAAFLRVKLSALDRWTAQRKEFAKLYTNLLDGYGIGLPSVPDYADPVWHLFVIRHQSRDSLLEWLKKSGIETGIHYPVAVHKLKCYEEYNKYKLPLSESLAETVLSLPISSSNTEDEIKRVAETVIQYLD